MGSVLVKWDRSWLSGIGPYGKRSVKELADFAVHARESFGRHAPQPGHDRHGVQRRVVAEDEEAATMRVVSVL